MSIATINGRACLASSEVSWTLTAGTRPHIQKFDMRPQDAEYLKGLSGPVELFLKGKTSVKVWPLYVIGTHPGENPNIRRIELADRRIWWPYKHIRRYYNCRRNFSFKRLSAPDAPIEAQGVDPDTTYALWSLKNKTKGVPLSSAKWKARDVFDDVMRSVLGVEKSKFGVDPGFFAENNMKDLQIDIENLFIDDSGDKAIDRILAYMPAASVFIGFTGEAVMFSKVSGKDKEMLNFANPSIVGDGDARVVTNERLRPSSVNVLFTFEPEVRFNYTEPAPTYGVNARYMENVLPIPDWSLDVTDTASGVKKTLPQGTWITFNEALAAWGQPPGFTSFGLRTIQKAIVPFLDLWAGIELSGAFQPNADWSVRVAAIQQHYRKTFRINRSWMDRIWKLKAYRVATLNPKLGTRSPALAYADYSVIASQRALFNEAKGTADIKDMSYGMNVRGYPTDGILKNGTTQGVPAKVEILDEDQGIIHVDFLIDPYRLHEAVLPGMITFSDKDGQLDANGFPVVGGNGPTGNIKQFARTVSFDAVSQSQINSVPKVTQNWKMAVILTAIPAAPNDENGLYRIKIQPDDKDLKKVLPISSLAGLSNAAGPPMEIRIGPGVETARVAWADTAPAPFLIGSIFGVLSDYADIGVEDLPDDEDPLKEIEFLILNSDKYIPSTGAANLRSIAVAAAARVYAMHADRVQGEVAANLDSNIKPAGWLAEVKVSVGRDGRVTSRLIFSERVQPIDLFSFMDASTRAIVMKLADPGK